MFSGRISVSQWNSRSMNGVVTRRSTPSGQKAQFYLPAESGGGGFSEATTVSEVFEGLDPLPKISSVIRSAFCKRSG
jgi:hypothetical protein